MNKHHLTLELPSYLCDRNDRLYVWAAMRLFQEVVEHHSIANGLGYKEMLEQNRIWILSRAYYMICRLPRLGEKIMLSTWARGADGLFAIRDYEMTSAEGQTLLAGTAYWPLMDYAAHKPVRLNGILDNFAFNTVQATDRATLNRLRLPDMSQPDGHMEQPVRFAMIDHAQHVNNAEYIKLIFDCLMQSDFDLDRPFSLELNYNHETQPGDKLSLLRKHTDGTDWFQISNSQGLSVTAKVSGI